jgi:BASS family bile acid:Na+ symporter
LTSERQLAFLALSIFLGVMFPTLASLFKPLLFVTIFLLFVFAIFQVRLDQAIAVLTRDRASWIVLAWQLLVLPLTAAVLLKPLLDGQWYVFTVVTLCTSAITATTALSRIFNLNDAMALSVCIVGTLIMPIPLYLILNGVVGLETQIKLSVYAERIVVFIVLPFLVVWGLRRILPSSTQRTLVNHTPTIVLGLLMVFGLSVMDGVRAMMTDNPLMLAGLVVLAFSISLVTQALTYLLLRFLGSRDAKTACLLCAYRNMGMVAAIAGAAIGENFLIFVGVWQLPMYILPLLLRRFYQH